MPKRDTARYELRKGNQKVYIGITNDPDRREQDHRAEAKDFDRMTKVGPLVTRQSALEWEKNAIEAYQRGHGGKKPPQQG